MKKDKESKLKILLPILAIIIVIVLIFNRLLFKLKDQVDKVALPVQVKFIMLLTELLV